MHTLALMGMMMVADPQPAKPFLSFEVVQGVVEYPGLNAEAGVFWDALKSGEFGLGASSTLLRLGGAVDLRIGYVRHESGILGGNDWEAALAGATVELEKLGMQTPDLLRGLKLGAWVGKDLSNSDLRGGVYLTSPLGK